MERKPTKASKFGEIILQPKTLKQRCKTQQQQQQQNDESKSIGKNGNFYFD